MTGDIATAAIERDMIKVLEIGYETVLQFHFVISFQMPRVCALPTPSDNELCCQILAEIVKQNVPMSHSDTTDTY